eukprot:CAMPEP_0179161062 /NCGR_PEP_ID=MMETSP0796-20121207/78808_1 /TAXON_ID=73915 /ORGANISM="Pyrodinium bahamense, Strain pbaha01" /LENGTH=39 /DNA_ID= /DNA_START= /DNA_END= /DNA_ORIENTATION=
MPSSIAASKGVSFGGKDRRVHARQGSTAVTVHEGSRMTA